jgi:pilus assembly protein CpaF
MQEPLLARDDIADIMVNGSNRIFIEIDGKIQQTDICFHDNAQLVISPICDARLPDGSRVNVIASPLAIDGAALTEVGVLTLLQGGSVRGHTMRAHNAA